MKVAVWHNLPSGGGLRALDNQVRGLSDQGHEVHLWSPPTAASFPSAGCATTNQVVPLHVIEERDTGLRRLGAAWRGERADLAAFADHSAQCARQINDLEPDVVLAHSCQFFRVPAIAQFLNTPSVAYLHEPNRRLYEATSHFPWIASDESRSLRPTAIRKFVGELIDVELDRIQVRSETSWVRAFDEVLVNSRFSRESVLRAYGRHSNVSLLGIDTTRFSVPDRPDLIRGNLLTVGALVPEKNAEFLVRAVAAAGPTVRRFTWVANHVDFNYREQVVDTAAVAGVQIDLRRSVSESELMKCYADADIFVYAPRLEPFGFAPLEANATGLPVVAIAEAGVRETVIDGVNGVIVEDDEAAFGAAVESLLADSARLRALGGSAREHVARCWPLEASIQRFVEELSAASHRAL